MDPTHSVGMFISSESIRAPYGRARVHCTGCSSKRCFVLNVSSYIADAMINIEIAMRFLTPEVPTYIVKKGNGIFNGTFETGIERLKKYSWETVFLANKG